MPEYNFLTKNLLRDAIKERAPRYLGGRLLDIGCGLKPYAELLEDIITEHVGVEHADTPHGLSRADRVGTVYELPAEDGEFDCALCTEVLEHVEEPARALAECARVLKPGAHALYTCPFIWHPHEEPRDFYRYTEHGLRYLLEQGGFDVVEISPLSGFWATFGQHLTYVVYRRHGGLLKCLRLVKALGWFLQRTAGWLDRHWRLEPWTSHYLAVARRRGDPSV